MHRDGPVRPDPRRHHLTIPDQAFNDIKAALARHQHYAAGAGVPPRTLLIRQIGGVASTIDAAVALAVMISPGAVIGSVQAKIA